MRPLASVEVTEKEDAAFETEISEDDVPGEWKLRGEVLSRSPVRLTFDHNTVQKEHLSSMVCFGSPFRLSDGVMML